MEPALRSAIYYVHGNDESYLKYHIVAEVMFDGTKSNLSEVTSNFRSDIRIRNLFGNKDNICYEVCDNLSRYYETLLINQLDVILVVTRHDNAVKITKRNNTNIRKYNDHTVKTGIIKIDSVIAELNITAINSGTSWYTYPLWVLGMGVMGVVANQIYQGGSPFGDLFKSD